MTKSQADWQKNIIHDSESEFSLDLNFSGIDIAASLSNASIFENALKEMSALESGAIANPDEQRMVGHYWLRASQLAPSQEIRNLIDDTYKQLEKIAAEIFSGKLLASSGKQFSSCLLVGIGGSALGPQFLEQALRNRKQALKFYYFDNTDPAGLVDTWSNIEDPTTCLVLVISKSGGTRETRNGMLFVEQAFQKIGVKSEKHLIAITQVGSALDLYAKEKNWLARIPMWDWVGGRVSLWSAVGVLPALFQGIDVANLLKGAAHMDKLGRNTTPEKNPALMLARTWYLAGNKQGERILVMLPYRDQLSLLAKYMQQLIMESVGKELDRSGKKVNQGLYVLGNKGSTDQHSYIQQLREGPNTFLAHFIEVLQDNSTLNTDGSLAQIAASIFEQNATLGDYLSGFLQGTRQALFDNQRPSVTITIPTVNAFYVGMLIALFERAVGFYASFINVNAYHQPGVEAGKKGAEKIIRLQDELLKVLGNSKQAMNLDELSKALNFSDSHTLFCIVRHLEANNRVKCKETDNSSDKSYYV